MSERLITILGPTAVGKTDLTLRLAKKFNSVVISGDAYQIYRGLDVGTAKPSPDELAAVPHRLIDICDPDDSYSAADFQTMGATEITRCNEQGIIPILSGGTGFYVQALLEGYDFSTEGPDAEVRQRLEALVADKGEEALLVYGEELAAKGGITLKFTDKHRLYRAIELMERGDYESLTKPTKQGLRYDGPVIGLERPREELYDRINRRVDIMVAKGLFEEVERLLAAGVSPDCQAFKGIGYKETAAYFTGELSKEDAVAAIKQNTRRFAKRQITWYKRMPYIRWISLTEANSDEWVYEQALRIIEENY